MSWIIIFSENFETKVFENETCLWTAKVLEKNHIPVKIVNKVLEGRPHIVDSMTNEEIDLIINTTEGNQSKADSYSLRRTALTKNIPYYTTIAGANAMRAIKGCT